jgi:hypothetical protein
MSTFLICLLRQTSLSRFQIKKPFNFVERLAENSREPDWITCGDPNTPARSLPKHFLQAVHPLRGCRLFICPLRQTSLPRFQIKKPFNFVERLAENSREPDWIRTNGLLLRRQLLYPTELPVQFRAKIMYLREERKLLLAETVNIFFISKITDNTTEIQAVACFNQLIRTC